ncbi:MAG: O-antigen ligase family protein [Thermoanaerobaculia bacterium]
MKRSSHSATRGGTREVPPVPAAVSPPDAWLSLVIIASVVAVGFFIVPTAKEAFRFPKDILIRAEGIVLIASWILLFLRGIKPAYRPADKPVALLVSAVIVWTGFTSLMAINRTLSAYAFAWTVTVAVILLSTYVVIGERRRMSDIVPLLVPALANAIIAICQATRIWSPVRLEDDTASGMRVTALIGNPNDTGGFLVAPVLVATALAIVSRRWRVAWAAAAVVMFLGLVATRSATATIACIAGLACIAITASTRRWRTLLALAAAAVIAGTVLAATGRVSINDVRRLKQIDALDQLLTYRVPPALAAWRIFLDHPLTGVGPGCWAPLYFDYKIAVERDHPKLFHSGQGWSNFAEVHNDHLEILAETGLPGYLLFIASLAFIGCHSFAKSGDEKGASETGRLARLLAFPAAAALAVLCLAHFPLQLASTTTSFVFVFATVVGWLRR